MPRMRHFVLAITALAAHFVNPPTAAGGAVDEVVRSN